MSGLTSSRNIPQGTHPTLEGVDGGVAPETVLRDAGPESDLDFQMSFPIIFPQGYAKIPQCMLLLTNRDADRYFSKRMTQFMKQIMFSRDSSTPFSMPSMVRLHLLLLFCSKSEIVA